MHRHRLLFVLCFATIASLAPAQAADPTLPPTATSEEVVWLTPIDVTTCKADDVRAAAKATMGDDASLIEREIAAIAGLAEHGVQTVLIAKCYGPEAERIPGSKDLHILRYRKGVDRERVAQETLECLYGSEYSESVATRWDGDWLTISGKDQALRIDDKPTKHAVRIEAAYRSLGKLPGVIEVPNQRLRDLDSSGRMFIPAFRDTPASNVAVNDWLLNCQWSSMAVKLGKEPAIRITVDMGSEAKAKKLLADFQQLQRDVRANPNLKLFDLCLITASLLKSPPTRKASQVSCQLDTAALKPLVVAAVLPPFKREERATEFAVQSQMQNMLWAYHDYCEKRNDVPDKLEDLKPYLIKKNEPDVDKGFKRAITNARTGECPGFAYTKPPDLSEGSGIDPAKVVLFQELKDGQPNPKGQRVMADGRIENNLNLEGESEED